MASEELSLLMGRTIVSQDTTFDIIQDKMDAFFSALERATYNYPVVDISSRATAIKAAALAVNDADTTVELTFDYDSHHVGAVLSCCHHVIDLDIQWRGLGGKQGGEWLSGEGRQFNDLSAHLATEIILLKRLSPLVGEGLQLYSIPNHSLLYRFMADHKLVKSDEVWIGVEYDKQGRIIRAGVSHSPGDKPMDLVQLQTYYLNIIN